MCADEKCWDPLEVLPLHISITILSYLDIQSLSAACQVSTLWAHISEDNDHLWRRHCQQHCHPEYIKRDRAQGGRWKVGPVSYHPENVKLRLYYIVRLDGSDTELSPLSTGTSHG